MLTLQSWIPLLDKESVPPRLYHELFEAALTRRAQMIAAGRQPPDMGVELLLACWIGADGLREKMKLQTQALRAKARSECAKCYGTGIEIIEREGARKCQECGSAG